MKDFISWVSRSIISRGLLPVQTNLELKCSLFMDNKSWSAEHIISLDLCVVSIPSVLSTPSNNGQQFVSPICFIALIVCCASNPRFDSTPRTIMACFKTGMVRIVFMWLNSNFCCACASVNEQICGCAIRHEWLHEVECGTHLWCWAAPRRWPATATGTRDAWDANVGVWLVSGCAWWVSVVNRA